MRTCGGLSVSVALILNVSRESTCTVLSGIGLKRGEVLAAYTVTEKLLVVESCGTPLSETFTMIMFVEGPWASVGVQVNRPLVEFKSELAGACSKLQTRLCGGASVSTALSV